MLRSQQDEHHAIQHFFHWREDNQRQGCAGSGNPSESFFLPYAAAKIYLSERQRVQDLLEAVFPEEDYAQYPDITAIQESYCNVFCILLCIGQARFINHFIRHEIDDQHLPLKAKPDAFPQSSTPFWDKFERRQWEFCAPIFKYNMDKEFDATGYVLPIIEKKELRKGGSGASTYKIVLHESYDRLHPDHRKRSACSEPKAHTYVLKTYRTKHAKRYYRSEVDGFKRLRYGGPNGKPCTQIIGFYGNFTQGDSYNILLEYADQGTLEDYFRNTPSPSNGIDIVTFWDGLLCGVFEALKIIHNAGQTESQEKPIFHGWHQDLKPANILVNSCSDEEDVSQSSIRRLYKSKFKVADLGLSHFRRNVASAEAADRDSRGSRTYGAPECCRDPITEESTLTVRQNVDVWSLGCVLSETVVWVINGHHHVEQYGQQRQEDTEEIDDFDEGDCFHNGVEVLKSVGQAHKAHLEDKRPKDCVTEKIVKLIEDDMLVEADARLNAKQLYIKAKKIIKDAKDELGMNEQNDIPETIQPQRNVSEYSAHHKRRATHKSQNDGAPGRSGNGSRQTNRQSAPSSPDSVPRESRSPHEFRSDDSSSTDDGYLDSQRGSWQDNGDTRGSRHNSHQTSQNFYQPIPPPESAEHSFSDHNHTGRNVAQGKRPARSPDESLEYRGTLSSEADSQAETIVPQEPTLAGTSHPVPSRTFPAPPPPGSPARHPSPSSGLPALDPPHHPLGRQDLTLPESNTVHRRSTSRPPVSFLSFEKAMQWKQDKKNGKPATLPDNYLVGGLSDRDCAFLVDDALSMQPYWSDVKKCLELLGYIVKETDKDGFEVYFTMNWTRSKPKKVKNATKLVAEAEGRRLIGQSDMRDALGRILDEYKGRLDKPKPSGLFGQKVKRLILYILTDGVWQDQCDIEPMILEMVRTTGNLGLHNAQIGIQFIQFGKDEEGSARLKHFDDGLGLKGNEDIVDNEPFKGGNVWKMLLGSVNKWLDGDEERRKRATGNGTSSSSQNPP